MFRNRFLILLGGCFLAASAAWAGEVGYVDCSNHPEGTQVFGKPRKTPDVLASMPCGERFSVLVYGFVFSQIETRDGKVGYVFSNLIAVDRAATAVQQAGTVQFTAAKTKVPATTATVVKPDPPVSAQPQPVVAQPAPAPASVPAPTTNLPETAVTVAQPNPPAPAQPQPVVAQPAPAPVPAPTTNVPEPAAAVAQPDRNTAAQPDPSPAEPAAPSIRPATERTSWEKPLPSLRKRAPLLELYGGYTFARLVGGTGTATNLNGAMGAFGWNVKPWLQIVGDSSYNVVTISGTKNVLYGNHFGPRYVHRGRNRWGLTPFVEALVGGSRSDTSVAGSSAYNTSANCISYKAGGGVDIHPSRHIDIRLFDVDYYRTLFDVDYYRTAFGTNLHQNNYWASTGIVIRLFGGGSE